MTSTGLGGTYVPLRIAVGPSLRLAGVLYLVHILAAVVVVLADIPGWSRAVLLAALAAGLYRGLRQHAWRSASGAIVAAVWDEFGTWRLTRADGRVQAAKLLGDSYVTVPLIVLNFRLGHWRRQSLVLTGDNTDIQVLRRLRVRVNLQSGPGADRAAAP